MMVLAPISMSQAAVGKIAIRQLIYQIDGHRFQNSLFLPTEKQLVPVVLLAPEWWGITDFERLTARRLAEKGYAVLIVDLFGEPFGALDLAAAKRRTKPPVLDLELMHKTIDRGYSELSKQRNVDASRVAAIGFGFGGRVWVDEARRGLRLKAVVDFYGTTYPFVWRPRIKRIAPELLILLGANDPYSDSRMVVEFEQEMRILHGKYRIFRFPHAYYGFARPGIEAFAQANHLTMKFDPEAARKAWGDVDALLKRTLSE